MASPKPFLRKTLCLLCGLTSVAFLVMFAVSFRFYTTLGIDSDRRESREAVCYRYYRIRWPGDGSFRVGGGVSHYHFGDKKLEPFDWGGRFFKAPRLDPPGTVWNQRGFRFIRKQYEDAWTIKDASLQKPSEFWMGIPSILPVFLFGFLAWFIRRRLKPEKSGTIELS